jgi:ankyrin repeat protein
MPDGSFKVTVRRQRPTPLMDAVQNQDVDAVASCIKRGDDGEARDSYGQTALHWAAKYESVEIVQLLLDAGADVNAQDEDGETPLQAAKLKGHHAIAELLASHATERDRTVKRWWQFWK